MDHSRWTPRDGSYLWAKVVSLVRVADRRFVKVDNHHLGQGRRRREKGEGDNGNDDNDDDDVGCQGAARDRASDRRKGCRGPRRCFFPLPPPFLPPAPPSHPTHTFSSSCTSASRWWVSSLSSTSSPTMKLLGISRIVDRRSGRRGMNALSQWSGNRQARSTWGGGVGDGSGSSRPHMGSL